MRWIPKRLWIQFLILWIVLAVLLVMIISVPIRWIRSTIFMNS